MKPAFHTTCIRGDAPRSRAVQQSPHASATHHSHHGTSVRGLTANEMGGCSGGIQGAIAERRKRQCRELRDGPGDAKEHGDAAQNEPSRFRLVPQSPQARFPGQCPSGGLVNKPSQPAVRMKGESGVTGGAPMLRGGPHPLRAVPVRFRMGERHSYETDGRPERNRTNGNGLRRKP
jgi:hypothetical protein